MSKDINELVIPEDVRYSKDHEWIKARGDNFAVGISDYAQDQLGDIVFVEVPEVGDQFEKESEFGTIESVKAVSEMYMPIGGEVVAVNPALEDSPELLNKDPYDKGWIVEIKPADPAEMDDLMDRNAYLEMLKGSQS
jgi:glycine cleavage system H protein